jgi:hypothetical protein
LPAKTFPCKKSICLQKKAFVYNIFVPSILLKADVKAQQILIPSFNFHVLMPDASHFGELPYLIYLQKLQVDS